MTREPLQAIADADGVTIGWTSRGDALLADVLRAAHARELAEHARRAAIRRGELPADPPAGRWLISDRH